MQGTVICGCSGQDTEADNIVGQKCPTKLIKEMDVRDLQPYESGLLPDNERGTGCGQLISSTMLRRVTQAGFAFRIRRPVVLSLRFVRGLAKSPTV
ncbi:MAG: hypothetical protein AB7U34_10295, partial [Novosphingobium sp.]